MVNVCGGKYFPLPSVPSSALLPEPAQTQGRLQSETTQQTDPCCCYLPLPSYSRACSLVYLFFGLPEENLLPVRI